MSFRNEIIWAAMLNEIGGIVSDSSISIRTKLALRGIYAIRVYLRLYTTPMKDIAFLLVDHCIPSSLVAPLEMLKLANTRSEKPLFNLHIIGKEKGKIQLDDYVFVDCQKTFDEVGKMDLVVIPAIKMHALSNAKELNQEYVPWLRNMHNHNNCEIASICVGAFLLASTGLLNGRRCSTHWAATDLFRQMFPEVELVPQYTITDYQGLYTSGGAFSFQNIMLYILEKYYGKDLAVWLSKMLLADMNKPSQLPFAIFNGSHHHNDETILKAQEKIEENYDSIQNISDLANALKIPHRTFVRRFKKATQNTPIEYLQKVKIEASKKALEGTNQTVNEIMYEVGYNDVKSFRSLFKRHTGLSPQQYRKKFSIEVLN